MGKGVTGVLGRVEEMEIVTLGRGRSGSVLGRVRKMEINTEQRKKVR